MPRAIEQHTSTLQSAHRRRTRDIGLEMTRLLTAADALRARIALELGEADEILQALDDGLSETWDAIDAALTQRRRAA